MQAATLTPTHWVVRDFTFLIFTTVRDSLRQWQSPFHRVYHSYERNILYCRASVSDIIVPVSG